MRVHYLQHVPFEGLGYIEPWLKENNHHISATRFFEPDYHLPNIDDFDALIIMGGPMGVYDEHQYPWLKQEKSFIRYTLDAGKKTLGICLGAQLIAASLGAAVKAAPHKEIGWFSVQPTEESKALTWLHELFDDNPVVFHWHGDRFDIPQGAVNLLTSEANSNQAFLYKHHVLGLQFHLEVTDNTIAQMLEHAGDDLTYSTYVQAANEIEAGKSLVRGCNELMAEIMTSLFRKMS